MSLAATASTYTYDGATHPVTVNPGHARVVKELDPGLHFQQK